MLIRMRKLIISSVCFLLVFALKLSAEYSLIRFELDSAVSRKISGIIDDADMFRYLDNYYDVLVTRHDRARIDNLGISYEVIDEDLTASIAQRLIKSDLNHPDLQSEEYFRFGSIGGYFSTEEIYSEFDRMSTLFPELIEKYSSCKSFEKRDINIYKVGKSSPDDNFPKPEILITSLHHAREVVSVFTVIYYLWDLFERYENGDETANYLLNNRIVYVIPNLNPDGTAYNDSIAPNGGGLWRKNRRKINDSTYGVDLNRNYGPYNAWDAPNGGSTTTPKNDNYRGSFPFSEPETICIRDFIAGKNIRLAAHLHTYLNAVLYPYSYTLDSAEDSPWYKAFLNNNFLTNKYLYGVDNRVIGYTTRGSADDFMYLGSDQFKRILSMTVEIGSREHLFWAPIYEAVNSAKKNIQFLDNLIFSGAQNVSVSNEEAVMVDGKFKISFRITNIGFEDIFNMKFKLLSPDNSIYFHDSTYNTGFVLRGVGKQFLIDYHPLETKNGTFVNLQLQVIEPFKKTIDFTVPVYEYKEYELLSLENANNIKTTGSWFLQFDTSGTALLKSNKEPVYGDYRIDNVYFTLPEFEQVCNLSMLRMYCKYDIEPYYDFMYFYGLNSEEEYELLTEGDYIIDFKYPTGASITGLTGIFNDYHHQNIILNRGNFNYNQLVMEILTDAVKGRKGWVGKSMKVRFYPDQILSIRTKLSSEEVQIAPNPVEDNVLLINSKSYLGLCSVGIYDIFGNQIYGNIREIEFGENMIMIPNFSSGMYFLKLAYGSKVLSIPFVIAK